MRLKSLLSSTLAAGMLLTPLSTVGREIAVLQDTVAGVGTQVQVSKLGAKERLDVLVMPPVGDEIVIPVQANANGEAIADIRGTETQRAGIYTVSLGRDGARTDDRSTFEVFADSLDLRESRLDASTESIDPNGRDSVTVTVTALDRYGNPISGQPFTLVSSRNDDRIDALEQQTDQRGEQRFEVSTEQAGTIALRAIDLISGDALDAEVQVDAGRAMGGDRYNATYNDDIYDSLRAQVAQSRSSIIDHFEIEAPSQMKAGVEAQEVTIRAVDRNGGTVETYLGTVKMTSPTDSLAVLPGLGSYRFEGRDLGKRTFSLALKFSTAGNQIFRVEDSADPSIFGQKVISVTGATNTTTGNGIVITSHKDGDTVNTDTIQLEGKGPAFANLLVMGGLDDVRGDTDRNGLFSIRVPLNPQQKEFTIRVRDDAGRNDSGPLRLFLDNVPPTIGTVTFDPAVPQEGTQVKVSAEAEAKLKSFTMEITNPKNNAKQTVTLVETATSGSGGIYTANFTAPENGNYQPKLTATDNADNSSQLLAQLIVGNDSLPKVQNLVAQGKKLAVGLTWDAVKEDVDGYRIYVGESANDFPYVLETGKPTTKATVNGLVPGQDYYFAVTALKGDLESAEKSNVAKAQAIGLVLTVKPGDAQLDLVWNPLPKEIPVSNYTVEYGVKEGNYQIKKTTIETADSLRDLVNGVTYFVRVTPNTGSGDAIKDLAVTGKGTPQGGLHPSAGDPIPYKPSPIIRNDTPTYTPPTYQQQPEQLSENGLPEMALWIGGGAALLFVAFQWQLRRSQRVTDAFLREMQSRYYR